MFVTFKENVTKIPSSKVIVRLTCVVFRNLTYKLNKSNTCTTSGFTDINFFVCLFVLDESLFNVINK